ncbi:hypothetical protein BBP40_002790 [Aspergillus hancockii]|nr:hypothetical protein BBP40_002790 [Aspergillus hancockii]
MDQVLKDYINHPSNHTHAVGFTLLRAEGYPREKQIFLGNLGIGSTSPFRDDTFIWLASATKIVTATAVLIAVQKGLIDLNEFAGKYIPELDELDVLVGFEDTTAGRNCPVLKRPENKITVHHLMTHTSGLAYLFTTKELRKWAEYHGRRSDELTSSLKDCYHPLLFEPGKGWSYGPGLDWAGRIVEIVAQCSLEEFCKLHIWDQIGAYDTTFRPKERGDLLPRHLDITRPLRDGAIKVGQLPYPLEPKDDLGGIGLWTTPRDFNLFMWHLFFKRDGLLMPEQLDLLLSPQVSDAGLVTERMHASTGGILTKTFPSQFPVNTGLSTCITLKDLPGRRPKGSVSWLGYPNIYWWFDPKNRILGILYLQLIPAGLSEAVKLLIDLEREVYREISGRADIQHSPKRDTKL